VRKFIIHKAVNDNSRHRKKWLLKRRGGGGEKNNFLIEFTNVTSEEGNKLMKYIRVPHQNDTS
jgi:hypothetical protein